MTASQRLLGAVAAVVVFVIVGLAIYLMPGDETAKQTVPQMLERIPRLVQDGNIAAAEEVVSRILEQSPQHAVALRYAAELAISRGRAEQALEFLARIPETDHEQWLRARSFSADLLHNGVHRLGEAEQAYLDVLRYQPDDPFANEGYAKLLAVCGRRSEAIPHVLKLLKLGHKTDLLVLLARESAYIGDPALLESAREAAPRDTNAILGQATAAAASQNFDEALALLEQGKESSSPPPAYHAAWGEQLLANDRYDQLPAWAQEIPTEEWTPGAWRVAAEMCLHVGDVPAAIRCFWESLKEQPESLAATSRLKTLLSKSGQLELAEQFARRLEQMNQLRDRQQATIMSSGPPRMEDVLALLEAYEQTGRFWEAYGWGRLVEQQAGHHPQLQTIMTRIARKVSTMPLRQTASQFNIARQVDLSGYPLPRLNEYRIEVSAKAHSSEIAFIEQHQEIGFDFRYFNGSEKATRRMFEFAGGGLAVLDFDQDGAADLFCTQGRPWGKTQADSSTYQDTLFQNEEGTRLRDVSHLAGIDEAGFGQGVAAGDVNNDGFPDLYVANTEANQLWLNNGDGTFTAGEMPTNETREVAWTTSVLIADLDADGQPDLYDVNYLRGEDLFERLCDDPQLGRVMCAPYDFDPAVDRLLRNLGDGQWHDVTGEFFEQAPAGKGLGVVAFDTGDGRLSLFVANDTTANLFYVPSLSNNTQFTDRAVLAGLAFNGEGKAEACMGIALADCDRDQRLDLVVTNFLYESNTFYSEISPGLYADQTREVDLHDATLPVLGFGTEFLDANADGQPELIITNGATQDLSDQGTPYEMHPQLFEWTGKKFVEIATSQLGPWAQRKRVGRALVTWDWNLDGRRDVAIGYLDSPYSVLTNTSTTENRELTLRFVATNSARDAFGVSVIARANDDAETYHQLTAGGGYQSGNAREIQIGCGDHDQLHELEIRWPSGATQRFRNISTNQCLLFVEQHGMYRLPRNSGDLRK